jgi:hypothetical protein
LELNKTIEEKKGVNIDFGKILHIKIKIKWKKSPSGFEPIAHRA